MKTTRTLSLLGQILTPKKFCNNQPSYIYQLKIWQKKQPDRPCKRNQGSKLTPNQRQTPCHFWMSADTINKVSPLASSTRLENLSNQTKIGKKGTTG